MIKKNLKVNCPTCKQEFSYYEKDSRPFCSERCRNHDFIAWTEEQRAIPSREHLSEHDLEEVIKAKRENELH